MNNSAEYFDRVQAEIHLDRAENNLRILRSRLDPGHTRAACVIKADAYGHGDAELMKLYQDMGVDFFAVSNLNEAVKLRQNGCKGDILILGWTGAEYADILAENNIIQAVLSVDYARELSKAASDKTVRVHIKLDTGMGRIGLDASDSENCAREIAAICSMHGLKPEGAFTHFAVADSYEEDKTQYTNYQKELFFNAVDAAAKKGCDLECVHCLNSAGALLHYDNRSRLARFGIVLYGLKPDTSLELPEGIEPVMDLKSLVSHIKTIHKGQSVSYGRTYIAERDTVIATVPVGYADGYPRLLSNKGYVIINGRKAPITGRVCMDQFMVDVTDIPDVQPGVSVTLIGKEGNETITADDIAELCGTIGYEIVCGISKRVPRVYIK